MILRAHRLPGTNARQTLRSSSVRHRMATYPKEPDPIGWPLAVGISTDLGSAQNYTLDSAQNKINLLDILRVRSLKSLDVLYRADSSAKPSISVG